MIRRYIARRLRRAAERLDPQMPFIPPIQSTATMTFGSASTNVPPVFFWHGPGGTGGNPGPR